MSKIHITADVPTALVEKVDAKLEQLERSRSYAIRKGLELFLLANSQEMTKLVNETGITEQEKERANV